MKRPADRGIWRVCRNILITESDDEAEDLLADPDGDFAFYFRYLKGLREMHAIAQHPDMSLSELNALLGVQAPLIRASSPVAVLLFTNN